MCIAHKPLSVTCSCRAEKATAAEVGLLFPVPEQEQDKGEMYEANTATIFDRPAMPRTDDQSLLVRRNSAGARRRDHVRACADRRHAALHERVSRIRRPHRFPRLEGGAEPRPRAG